MNYFAHGIRFLDRPYFLAGLAVPDWLSVVDRRSRVRGPTVRKHLEEITGEDREVLLGVLQHLEDDQWFHGTQGFYEVTADLGRDFRENLPADDEWRCGFLGHIVMELLLDSVLIEREPEALQRYYRVLDEIDPTRVEQAVTLVATQPPLELSRFIGLYQQERFLEDYTDNSRLLRRLNQVMRRVKLNPLPEGVQEVLERGRDLVRRRLDDLLPESQFGALP